ncbi:MULTISPECIES: exodeoxyribonuclease VII small subunit [Vagococcus]|uniref:Exodeoxyribonuclease 7 small subunit n=2 Tax=Vagococcus lutrae TaxID=81947 RepID=V6Q4S8_9ENTE|nr:MULTISPECIES: exodeoxyribonuclease VII small subunit [Vagococcus]EST90124.1 exodeoxyribonuclease VII, small subunit [Vagococcus lutrae LBD1]MDO5741998.1 exodeoxyribonuclease VII small subunit [Vagococcus sp.]MDT2801383.1 exodeoxyribonuclease VII small subunit [Vagococcus lutrae]MDT2805801.1 exodeoxyribonuclease VII small subunit [Vagococcus lutrae]MDT2807861.1 exodeoxyribonuclease VII small subunit [Vagococcus lutrae]
MATKEKMSFEVAISELETIVKELERGDIPLEKALTQFKKGVELSQMCQKKLADADEMLTKIMNEDGTTTLFDEGDSE